MIERPFKMICEQIDTPDTLIVQIQCKNPANLTEERLKEFELFFRTLEEMASLGGLAGHAIDPGASTLRLSRQGRIKPDVYECVFDKVCVDVRTIFIIQNMVHTLHQYEMPIAALHVFSPMIKPGSEIPQNLPRYHKPLPFELVHEIEDISMSIEMDFVERQYDKAVMEPFLRAWDIWTTIAVFGCFCDELCFSRDMKAYLLSDPPEATCTGITFFEGKFFIDEAGLYCFLNMLSVLHRKVAAIDEVRIY